MSNESYVRTISGFTIGTTVGGSTALDMEGYNDGIVEVVSGTVTTLSFHVSVDNITYYQLHDAANVAIAVTATAGRAYALPVGVLGCRYLKITAVGAGVGNMHRKTP